MITRYNYTQNDKDEKRKRTLSVYSFGNDDFISENESLILADRDSNFSY